MSKIEKFMELSLSDNELLNTSKIVGGGSNCGDTTGDTHSRSYSGATIADDCDNDLEGCDDL